MEILAKQSLTLAVGGLCVWAVLRWLSRPSVQHPPGPQGYPLVGYLKPIQSPAWKTYKDWGKEYRSDLVRLNILGNNIIVANTFKAATDLLDKRSSIYSDRPVVGMTMVNELVGFDWSTAGVPYGPYWRESRKMFQQTFNPQASQQYRLIETTATRKLLSSLLESPKDFRKYTRYLLGRVIIRASYGIDVQETDDPYIAAAERGVWIANQCMKPGAYLVDLIPILKYVPEWMPGAGFKRKANIWRKEIADMATNPFVVTKQRTDLPADCAAKTMFESIDPGANNSDYVEDVVIKNTLATMYAAGSDTTTSILDTFFLAMSLHPDIQREAQKSIDRVCEGRLPEFSDYNALPHVHAIVKECLRWRPALPLGVPHSVTQDDVYEGYFIPAKSMVFPNIRAILHDPNAYPEPDQFKPARFLKRVDGGADWDVKLNPDILDPSAAVFGFGRRFCPGRWMVYDTLWIAIASILATFDISPTVDEHGASCTAEVKYTDTFITYPEHFTCTIASRSPSHEDLISSAAHFHE